ncbi:MAG: cell division protein ZipA C-terminal FtsZ-binding domain-containing protein [Phycisphaerales bacterium]|nr:cell division protein ZipA C-terminal FtsZ-binding domain-containing protein [Phycisphaerales bacterium]
MELDKTQLQWLLAGIGALVIILLFLWGIRSHLKKESSSRRRRPSKEPVLNDHQTPPSTANEGIDGSIFGESGRITPDHHLADKVLVDVEIRPVQRQEAFTPDEVGTRMNGGEKISPSFLPPPPSLSHTSRQEPITRPSTKKTLVLTVMAPRHQLFDGARIQAAAEALGFHLNTDGVFELFPDTKVREIPILGLAHLRKPGSFDPKTWSGLRTPGLLLFMKLPGPIEEMKALDELVITADQLAQKLGGLICDERRNRMTNQALIRLRNEVAELKRMREQIP